MCKQVMVCGVVFGLSSNEVEITYDGKRLSPRYCQSLSLKEKDLVSRAVDALSSLSSSGEVLKHAYHNIY